MKQNEVRYVATMMFNASLLEALKELGYTREQKDKLFATMSKYVIEYGKKSPEEMDQHYEEVKKIYSKEK